MKYCNTYLLEDIRNTKIIFVDNSVNNRFIAFDKNLKANRNDSSLLHEFGNLYNFLIKIT